MARKRKEEEEEATELRSNVSPPSLLGILFNTRPVVMPMNPKREPLSNFDCSSRLEPRVELRREFQSRRRLGPEPRVVKLIKAVHLAKGIVGCSHQDVDWRHIKRCFFFFFFEWNLSLLLLLLLFLLLLQKVMPTGQQSIEQRGCNVPSSNDSTTLFQNPIISQLRVAGSVVKVHCGLYISLQTQCQNGRGFT